MSTTSIARPVLAVGIDTARYGHHVTILGEDQQQAVRPFSVAESAEGYARLGDSLARLRKQHPEAEFRVRIDAAGQYAVNLERFLRGLPGPLSISVGEPKRNQDYRKAICPKRKSDAAESYAMSRFALAEQPRPTAAVPPAWLALREVASRLEGQVRQNTRLVNRLHNLLARVFPELAVLQADIAAGWVLCLLKQYPTARRIAAAQLRSLEKIPYLKAEQARAVHEAARRSIGALQDDVSAELVQQLAMQLEAGRRDEQKLRELLASAYDALPPGNHRLVESIVGIGRATAAALVAKIVDINRFETPDQLVSYFGAFPEERSSGVDRRGNPLPPGAQRMSTKGNDLVRGYLWMAAQTAAQHNPAVQAIYARQCARGKRGYRAYGACMRKLLCLVFAVWKSGRPFDPAHYPWEGNAAEERIPAGSCAAPRDSTEPAQRAENKTAAGHKRKLVPQRKVVTAATSKVRQAAAAVNQERPAERRAAVAPPAAEQAAVIVEPPRDAGAAPQSRDAASAGAGSIDFAELRRKVTMEQILRRLGVWDSLHGGAQRRGPCPIHAADGDARRSFSVNPARGVFRCFHPPCVAHGNVLDLWAAVHRLPLYEAALHLAETFHLPLTRTEKRNP